jgi:hypothetical protein
MALFEDEPVTRYSEVEHGCPFDYILNRCPYLVLPKLAIQSMPMPWRRALAELLEEAEDAGLQTPAYHVFRDDGERSEYTRARVVNELTGFTRLVKGREDPWANYKYGNIHEICPTFKLGRQQ